MNRDYTHIEVVLDRSGSMSTIKADMEGGFKTFLNEQKEVPGKATITVTQFDNEFETVIDRADIRDVSGITLEPRGWTALYDALGRRISACGEWLAGMAEKDRPGLVVFVIITDGCENSSSCYNATDIQKMIKHQEERYNWCFVYLGANQDAFAMGSTFGIAKGATYDYTANTVGVTAMYADVSAGIGTARMFSAQGQTVTSSSLLNNDQSSFTVQDAVIPTDEEEDKDE